MAIIYYPKGNVIFKRDAMGGSFEQVEITSTPNTIVYFDVSSSAVSPLSASSLDITASWSSVSVSASYSLTASYVENSGSSGTSLSTGSTYPITSSWAISSSWAPTNGNETSLSTGSTYPITASWSVSASWAPPTGGSGTTLETGSTYPITASWAIDAISASWAPSTGGSGTTLETGSTYPITSSWSVSASWAPMPEVSGAESASWASSSISSSYSENSATASYISGSISFNGKEDGYFPQWVDNTLSATSSLQYSASALYLDGGTGNLIGTSSWAISASYAPNDGADTILTTGSTYPITSSWSVSASWAPSTGGGGTTLETGSTYPITASWAQYALTASYIDIIPSGSTESASYAETASYALNAGGGSSTQTLQLPVYSAKMSGSAINAADTNWELRFPTGSSPSAIWQFRMPDNYSSNLKNTIQFYPTQSQIGNSVVGWRMDLTHISNGATASVYTILPQLQVSLTHSLDFNQSASWLREESVYLTGSNLQGGDLVIYKLSRVSGSANTATGSIAVVSNMLEWTTE